MKKFILTIMMAALPVYAWAGNINLSWTNSVVGETGVRVMSCTTGSGPCDTMLADLAPDAVSWVDPNAAVGAHWYRVVAYNGAVKIENPVFGTTVPVMTGTIGSGTAIYVP